MDPQEIKMIVQIFKEYDKKIKIDKNKLKSATSKYILGSWDNNLQELEISHGILYFNRNIRRVDFGGLR